MKKRTDDVSSSIVCSCQDPGKHGPIKGVQGFFFFFLLHVSFNDLKMKRDRKNLANVRLHQIDLVPSGPP